jgi:hypothetical protein
VKDVLTKLGQSDTRMAWIDDAATEIFEYVAGEHILVDYYAGLVARVRIEGKRTLLWMTIWRNVEPKGTREMRILGAVKNTSFSNLPDGAYNCSALGPGIDANTRGLMAPIIFPWRHPALALTISSTYQPFRNVVELVQILERGTVKSNAGGGIPIEGILFAHPVHGYARLRSPLKGV